MAGTGKSGPIIAFSVPADYYGNQVHCTYSNWMLHIEEHPEIAGAEEDVKRILVDPDEIAPSTKTGQALVFSGQTSQLELRVVVYYKDPSKMLSGGTTGAVASAHGIDRTKFNRPRVGKPIYQKKENLGEEAESKKEEGQ